MLTLALCVLLAGPVERTDYGSVPDEEFFKEVWYVALHGKHSNVDLHPAPPTAPAPEPCTLLSLAAAGGAAALWRRKRRK